MLGLAEAQQTLVINTSSHTSYQHTLSTHTLTHPLIYPPTHTLSTPPPLYQHILGLAEAQQTLVINTPY